MAYTPKTKQVKEGSFPSTLLSKVDKASASIEVAISLLEGAEPQSDPIIQALGKLHGALNKLR